MTGRALPDGGTQPSPRPDGAEESDLPSSLARPARRALDGAGLARLSQLAALSEAEVLRLHGMGPRAMDQLRRALADRGLRFAGAPADAPAGDAST